MKLYAAVLGTPFCSVVCVFQKYKELISKIGGSNHNNNSNNINRQGDTVT